MRLLARLVAVIVLGGLAAGLLVVALAVAVEPMAHVSSGRTERLTLETLNQRSIVYDDDGNVLASLRREENRSPVPLNKVSQTMVRATLAVEDEHFYQHEGFNLRATTRALARNAEAGRVEQGGSTITQQVVKLSFLTPKRDVKRKVQEAIIARRLERQFSKAEILEHYLNSIYLGNSAYGVQAAAETYFGVDADELDVPQAALLAGMIRNPVGYDPFKFPDAARKARRLALRRMVATDQITERESTTADSAPLPTDVKNALPPPDDYFVAEVKRQLQADPRLGDTPAERYNAVFRGGLRVYTTFDARLQKAAVAARDKILPDTEGRFTAAMLSLDPRSGAVRAMVGGPGFDQWKYNLTTSGDGRQTGSSFKPIVLAAGIESGEVVPDDIINGLDGCSFENPPRPDYKPSNYDGQSGFVGTVSSAMVSSLNCAFVRLGLVVGLPQVAAVAKRLGIESTLSVAPSMSLGTSELHPIEMAAAFGVFAADGVRHEPFLIKRVVDAQGNEIFRHRDPAEQVIRPQTARLVNSVLRKVVSEGTGTRAQLAGGRQVAGKTGTNQDYRDAWFVGYTPQLATAVWMGNPRKQDPMRNVGGTRVTGGTYPARMFKAFMDKALAGQPALTFKPPSATRAGQYLKLEGEDEQPLGTSTSSSSTDTTLFQLPTFTLPNGQPVPTLFPRPGGGTTPSSSPPSTRPGDREECFPFCDEDPPG